MALTNGGLQISVTLETLEDVAKTFLQKEYGLKLDIPIKQNNRYRTTMGAFLREYDDDSKEHLPSRIEIAGWVLDRCHIEVVFDTLYHECVHYALHALGRQFHDGQFDFENELKRLGISSNYD